MNSGASVFLSACAPAKPSVEDRETAALAPLKKMYSGVVMGFDFAAPATLVVSLDLQAYDGMGDSAIDAMQHAVLDRWKTVWRDEHPREHAVVRVLFIDFIGRKVAEKAVRV